MKKLFAVISLLLLPIWALQAQTLAFNIEAAPDLTVTVMSDGVLDFGNLLQNQRKVQIQLMDPETEIISIEGDSRCEVTVSITPPSALILDADNELPFTLGAAFANEGEENKNQATVFKGNQETFFLDGDRGGGPPCGQGGPPGKGPPGQGGDSITAYVYIYGDISVGNVRAGTYSETINIYVKYD